MLRIYRVTKSKHVATAWTGEGARQFGGRWNHPGTPCVYCSQSLALAALEMLVHLQADQLLDAYSWAWVDVAPAQVRDAPLASLPTGWDSEPATGASRDVGTDWLRRRTSVALRVPSAIIPAECNVLLNPDHPDFAALARGPFAPFKFDPRLLKQAATP